MHDQTVTFVLAGADGQRLLPLTADLPKPLVPFGGVFRILDFTLGNLLNSHFRRLYFVTQYKPERVTAYIREGWAQLSKEFCWDRGEDLTCLPPSSIFQSMAVIEKSRAEHVLIVSADQIYQFDYNRLLQHHIETQADLTVCFKGLYLLRREAAMQLVRKYGREGKDVSLENQVVPAIVRSGRASQYDFTGYSSSILNLDDYHAANMDLLAGRFGFDPYGSASWPIRPLSGTKHLQDSRYASTSRVALGARLSSCRIVNSVISAGVRVDTGAEIENTVVLPGCHIGAGSRIRNAILTENATVLPNTTIGFGADSDGITLVETAEKPNHSHIQRRCARVATKACSSVSR